MTDHDEPRTAGAQVGLVKSVFDIGWKIVAVLWVVFQFYSTQDSLVKSSHSIDDRITNIQNKLNELDRKMVQRESENIALRDLFQMQDKFYSQTHDPRK